MPGGISTGRLALVVLSLVAIALVGGTLAAMQSTVETQGPGGVTLDPPHADAGLEDLEGYVLTPEDMGNILSFTLTADTQSSHPAAVIRLEYYPKEWWLVNKRVVVWSYEGENVKSLSHIRLQKTDDPKSGVDVADMRWTY